jgi:hypothetical protein
VFEGFTLERIDVRDAELRVRHGGSGPPVLLLHGHPRTQRCLAFVDSDSTRILAGITSQFM